MNKGLIFLAKMWKFQPAEYFDENYTEKMSLVPDD